jgi:hypothetical protein
MLKNILLMLEFNKIIEIEKVANIENITTGKFNKLEHVNLGKQVT